MSRLWLLLAATLSAPTIGSAQGAQAAPAPAIRPHFAPVIWPRPAAVPGASTASGGRIETSILVGAGIGALIGGLAGYEFCSSGDTGSTADSCLAPTLLGAGILATAGAIIGAIVGSSDEAP